MRRPLLLAALALLLVVLLGGAWYALGRRGAPLPNIAALEAVLGDSAAHPADSTPRPATGDSVPTGDTVTLRLPHPPHMVGRWYHGDQRSRFGDSLTLVLNENGTAELLERHYTLDRTGWHLAHVERQGSWAMRYRGDRVQLCTKWTTPKALDDCSRANILPDTIPDEPPLMEYAGRHWRKTPPAKPTRAKRGAKGP